MLASSTKICFQIETSFKVGQKFWDCIYDYRLSFLHELRASIAKYLSEWKRCERMFLRKLKPILRLAHFIFLFFALDVLLFST